MGPTHCRAKGQEEEENLEEEEEEEEEEEFAHNRTRARRDSSRDVANTQSRNADFNQSADETRTPGGEGGGVYGRRGRGEGSLSYRIL